MARDWYCRVLGGEMGPLKFSQLVDMVRSGTLLGDDHVRADTEDKWSRADAVIGLFYMAERPSVGPTYSDQVEASDAVLDGGASAPTVAGDISAAAPPAPTTFEVQPTAAALGSVTPYQIEDAQPAVWDDPTAEHSVISVPASANPNRSIWSETVSEAMQERGCEHYSDLVSYTAEKRYAKSHRYATRTRRDTRQLIRTMLVILGGLFGANLAVFGLTSWTEREELRFPTTDQEPARQLLPLIGDCSATEYWLAVGHTAAIVGAMSVAGGRWLVQNTG